MRLIASSIIVLAGAVLYGFSATIPSTRSHGAGTVGAILLGIGAIGFLIDYASYWRGDDTATPDEKKTP